MRKVKALGSFVLVLATVLAAASAFQSCGHPPGLGNGNGYGGLKPGDGTGANAFPAGDGPSLNVTRLFHVEANPACADGSISFALIEVSPDGFTLTRDNCADVAPVEVAAELVDGRVYYRGMVFTPRAP